MPIFKDSCFSPVITLGRLINLFLVNYCCVMLIL